ncbi:PfkB family carbohydrate kinase [Streptomyces sp. NPDC127084]|uniref:PfkB family carbohydrate kinase n=1 Tax=Streptomyces sp. NPDC127084 TaxID=3347133 RepID=UPI00364B5F5E
MSDRTRQILVMGEALVDLVPGQGGSTICRALPGGAPANVAAGLARLGIRSFFSGALSDDPFGTLCEKRLTTAGADVTMCARSSHPTALAVALPDTGTNRYEFYHQRTATFQINPVIYDLDRFCAVYVGGLAAVVAPAAAAVLATARAAAAHSVLAVDPNVRQVRGVDPKHALDSLRKLCDLAHIVKTSDEDAVELWPHDAPEVACRKLAADGRLVILTRGGRGSSVFLPLEDSVSVPAITAEIVNTIGAGDAFMAGILARLSREGMLRRRAPAEITPRQARAMLQQGALMAARVCEQPGADLP